METHLYWDNLQTMEAEPFHKFYGKVNFIYIDPPYKQKHFFYNDNNDEWTNDILLYPGQRRFCPNKASFYKHWW